MGLLKDLAGIAAPIVGNIIAPGIGGALGGALGGAISSSGGPKSQTTTQQQQLDPRIQQMLFGQSGSNGLLSQFQGLLNQPQTLGSQVAGQLSSNYLAGALPDDVSAIRNSSLGLMNANAPNMQFSAQRFDTPTASNPLWVQQQDMNAAQVKAPSQNNIDLSAAYQNFIYGNPAENKYLTDALNASSNQSRQAFNTLQGDITNNLQRSILPGIRGGAIASGQYGGSRQGIAEGLALSDANRQAQNAAQQIGLADISARTGAQAGAFESGQNRALQATQGLGAQQYGVAQQNAQLQQEAAAANARANLQAQLANQGAGNQFTLSNQQAQQATNQLNAGQGLATNQLNSQNALQASQQNNAARIAGIGALQGLGSQLYGYNQNAQNADLQRAQGVAGLLSPFIGVNQSSTSSSPLYQNKGANILGGAAAGLGLYNQFSNMFNKPAANAGTGSFLDAFGSQY